MIRQSLPEFFTKRLGLSPQGFSQFLKQISRQFLSDFCVSPPSVSLICSHFLTLPCSLSCSISQLPHSSLCFPDTAPTFSRTCPHNSTHFTCFLSYCPPVSPTGSLHTPASHYVSSSYLPTPWQTHLPGWSLASPQVFRLRSRFSVKLSIHPD